MRSIRLVSIAGAALGMFLASMNARADDWVQLPYNSDTMVFDLGAGINAIGDKVGPCLKPSNPTTLANGISFLRFAVLDRDSNSFSSTSESKTITAEGGARFGVGGGGAKYSNSKTSINESNRSDRSINILLEAYSDVSTEQTYGFELTVDGSAFLKKSPFEFVDKCGAVVAVEVTRSVTVRAVITVTFASVATKRSTVEKMDLSADGNYGAFNAKASIATTLDKLLTTADERFDLNVDVQAKGENGLQGYGDMAAELENAKTDPFKSTVAALASLLKSRSADKGAANKVLFRSVDAVVPALNLLPWTTRRRFWTQASDVYETLLGLEQVQDLRKASLGAPNEGGDDGLLAKAVLGRLCKQGVVDQSNQRIKNLLADRAGCPVFDDDIGMAKDRLAQLMTYCLGAGTDRRAMCNSNGIVIVLSPLLLRYLPDELRLNTVPPELDPRRLSDGEAPINPEGETPVAQWSDEHLMDIVNASFQHWLTLITMDDAWGAWKASDFERAEELIDCCTHATGALDKIGADTDSFLAQAYSTELGIFATDVKNNTEIPMGLTYVSSEVWLEGRGVFIPKRLYFIAGGSKFDFQFDRSFGVMDGKPLMYWYGDGSTCASGSCEPTATKIRNFLLDAKEPRGELFMEALTVRGLVTEFVATLP